MNLCQAIFVVILIHQLGSFQNKVYATDAHDDITRECEIGSLIEGCRSENNFVLNLTWDDHKSNVKIEAISTGNEKCCNFTKINGSFIANIDCVAWSCNYNLQSEESPGRIYSLNGSLLHDLKNNCPEMEELCLDYSKNCPLKNIALTPVYENINRSIRLNISWDEIEINENVRIEVNSNSSYCLISLNESSQRLLVNTNYVFLPKREALPNEQIKPGCTYNIGIHSEETDFSCQFSYVVPDCVKSNPKILKIKPTIEGNFLIEWDPGKAADDTSYIIESVDFSVKSQKETKWQPVEVVWENIHKHTSEVLMWLPGGEKYMLQGTFRNNFSCVDTVVHEFVIEPEISECETKPQIEAQGCKNENNFIININWHEYKGKKFKIESIKGSGSDKCCDFKKIDDSFVASAHCVQPFCTYDLYYTTELLGTVYSINGSRLHKIQNNCSNMEELCLDRQTKCILTNLGVTAIQQWGSNFLSLNISWDTLDINETATIAINPNPNYKNSPVCYFSSNEVNYNLMSNHYLQPRNENPQVEIRPGCEYNIKIHSESEENYFWCETSYIVPECVKKICDCDKFKPKPKILGITEVSKDKYLIKWDPGLKTLNNKSYTMKIVDFTYRKFNTLIGESVGFVHENMNKHTSEVTMKLFEEEKYVLTGTFTNNFSCPEVVTYQFRAPTKAGFHTVHIIIIVGVILLSLAVIVKCSTVKKYGHKLIGFLIPSRRSSHVDMTLTTVQTVRFPMNTNIQYTPIELLNDVHDEYEFPRNKIKLEKCIGRGAFGLVYSAKAEGIGGVEGSKMVAVKTLGEGENITKEAKNDFKAEIEIFKKIGQHPNIVTLLGCCSKDAPYMMIMEFVPCGNLINYLIRLREQWLKQKNGHKSRQVFFPENSDGSYIEPISPSIPSTPTSPMSITSSRLPSTSETVCTTLEDSPKTPLLSDYSKTLEQVLDHTELQNFALQIAKGMAYLEEISITHRDLAARNILMSENKTLKISDFGLSRSGPYINHKKRKLPLRWMAIEAITEQKYDSKSDVWSFGVVLWEIGTLGAFPYDTVPDSFVQQFLQLGRRLERPEICTDELYAVMKQCWATDPEQRPTFQELVDALDVNKRKIYVNFSQLNPTYVFPPSEINQCDINLVKGVASEI